MTKQKNPKQIETLTHPGSKRPNIPSAEHQSVMEDAQKRPTILRYPRNTDQDPQLVWRGKDEQYDEPFCQTVSPNFYVEPSGGT